MAYFNVITWPNINVILQKYTKLEMFEPKGTVIGSVFPERSKIENYVVRTTRINAVLKLICTLDAGFSRNENGTSPKKIGLSRMVVPKVRLGSLFISDLKRIAHIGSLERLDAELAKYKNKSK